MNIRLRNPGFERLEGLKVTLYLTLVLVLTDPEVREDLATAGYAQAKKFSWQKTAQATLDLYNFIANFA